MPAPDRQPIGRRLRKARLEAGLTLHQTADLAGVNRALPSFVEQGRRHPAKATYLIAKALGVDLEIEEILGLKHR